MRMLPLLHLIMKTMNIETLNDTLGVYQKRNNQILEQWLNQLPTSTLSESMKYATLLGGKRLRPFLCYATGALFGAPLAALDTPAAALECIHTYSLIHDDLPSMDNDNLRRGKPTCHVVYGDATAILAGDALQTLAFSIMAEGPLQAEAEQYRIAMIQSLARASGGQGMCLGQSLDLQSENRLISLTELERVHRNKTGALIIAAVELGAYTAGESAIPYLSQLMTYAAAIGLAFQVHDDILDITSDTETLGKPQGSDLNANKNTYPALLGLKGAKQKAEQLVEQAIQTLDDIPYNTQLLEQFAHYTIDRNN